MRSLGQFGTITNEMVYVPVTLRYNPSGLRFGGYAGSVPKGRKHEKKGRWREWHGMSRDAYNISKDQQRRSKTD